MGEMIVTASCPNTLEGEFSKRYQSGSVLPLLELNYPASFMFGLKGPEFESPILSSLLAFQ
jgi:hypothetical protein